MMDEIIDDLKQILDRVKYHGDMLEPVPFLEKLIERLESEQSCIFTQQDLDDEFDRGRVFEADEQSEEKQRLEERIGSLEELLEVLGASLLGNEEKRSYGSFTVIKGGKE